MKLKLLSIALVFCFYSKINFAQNQAQITVEPSIKNKIIALLQTKKDLKITQYDSQLIEINLGSKTLFASSDGKYIFAGAVIDTHSKTNIVELKEKQNRKIKLDNLPKEMRLSFPATAKQQHSITLFTDIDCGYCRRFHKQIPELNAKGISVNYIMLPRAGLNSPSFDKTNSVLCSDNPQLNMTLAMNNQFNANNVCKSNLKQQLALASEFSISSTPTIILPDGSITPGYLATKQLTQILN
jgi:thiol:disulfide interchange protein DsbC